MSRPIRPGAQLIVSAMFDASMPRRSQHEILGACGRGLADAEDWTVRRCAMVLSTLMYSLPDADPFVVSRFTSDPYDDLKIPRLYLSPDLEMQLVTRWGGMTDLGSDLLAHGPESWRLADHLLTIEPDQRMPAWVDTMRGVWRRVTAYGMPLERLLMDLSPIDAMANLSDLNDSLAEQIGVTMQPPAAMVEIVTARSSTDDLPW